MLEHRVALLGASLRRREDPLHARDPRVRAVVAQLAALPSPEPRAHFRAELRAQLVAVAPRIVAEGEPSVIPAPDRDHAASPAPKKVRSPGGRRLGAKHADGALAGRGHGIALARPLSIAASVIVVLTLLLGGAVWMSQKALPGDALYGLKRASESFQLATDSGNTAKAKDYLDFAGTRADEVDQLLGRTSADALGTGPTAAGAVSSHTAALVTATLGSADSDVKSAATLLGKQAISEHSASPLAAMTTWAPGQVARLRAIAAAVPSGSLRNRITASSQLVSRALQRADALTGSVACACTKTASSDELGPVPCPPCSSTKSPHHATTNPSPTSVPGSTRSGRGATGTHRSATTSGAGGHTSQSTGPATSGSRRTGATTLPTLPKLPVPTATPPTLPIHVNSCGISASLGGIGVGLGGCPPGVHISAHH